MSAETNQTFQFSQHVHAEMSQITDPVLSDLKKVRGVYTGKDDIHQLFNQALENLMETNHLAVIEGGLPAGGKTRIKQGLIISLRSHSEITEWTRETGKTNEITWTDDYLANWRKPKEDKKKIPPKPSESLKIRVLGWANYFYLGQKTVIPGEEEYENPRTIIAQTKIDPVSGKEVPKTIDDITPDDADNMSSMMEYAAKRIIDRHERIQERWRSYEDRVINSDDKRDKTSVRPLVLIQESPLLPGSNRGFKSAKLIKNRLKNTVGIFNIGDEAMQRHMGESGFRADIQAATIDTMLDVFKNHNIDPQLDLNVENPQKVLENALQKWKRSGATPGAIRKVNALANRELFKMYQDGEMIFPRFRYNRKESGTSPFEITSEDDFNKYPSYRLRLIAANLYKKGAEEIGLSQEQVLISMNHKQEHVVDAKLDKHNVAQRLLGFREAAKEGDLFYHPRKKKKITL